MINYNYVKMYSALLQITTAFYFCINELIHLNSFTQFILPLLANGYPVAEYQE
jgi:hypothetical protein